MNPGGMAWQEHARSTVIAPISVRQAAASIRALGYAAGSITLLLCLDYGGHQEIVDAMKKIARKGIAPEDITVDIVAANLYAPDVPPIDLIIRTSGEQRLSNFMTWESTYSELIFVKKNWPDFAEADLSDALQDYANQHRRFGK